MQRPITRGAAANAGLIFHIFAMDSTSTTGAGKASVAYSSWSCRYLRNGETISGAITPEDISTLGTYAAPTANTNIRIKAVDNTNMIGVYEVQIHLDWVNITNNCQALTIYLTASGVATLPIQIPLEIVNRQSATAFITGINSLAPPTNWNLISIDANGRLDIIKVAGTSQTAGDIIGDTNDIQTRLPAALVSGRMASIAEVIAAAAISNTTFAAGALDAAALAADAATEIANSLLDQANGVETGLTPRNSLRLIAAAVAGVLAGAATTTVTILSAESGLKTRITATVDADGNRSVIVTDLT